MQYYPKNQIVWNFEIQSDRGDMQCRNCSVKPVIAH